MAITASDRANQLRQAAAHGRRHPDDLFGARMTIHEAFEGTDVDSNRICSLLISTRPPISEWDCRRLEMAANLIDQEHDSGADELYDLCEMAKRIAPW